MRAPARLIVSHHIGLPTIWADGLIFRGMSSVRSCCADRAAMRRGRDLPATEIALLRTVRSAVWGQMPVREHHAVAATGFAPVRREVVTMKSEGGPTTAEITGRAAERRTTPAVGRIAERFVAMIVAPAGVRRIAAAAVPACDHRIVEAAAPVAGLSIAVEAADLVVDRSVAAAERVDDPLEAGHPAVRGPEAAAAVGVVRGSLLCPTIQPVSHDSAIIFYGGDAGGDAAPTRGLRRTRRPLASSARSKHNTV